jgi:hypothetical protein
MATDPTTSAAGLPYYENVQIGTDAEGRPIVRPELRGRRICTTPAEAQEDTLLYGDYFSAMPLLGEDFEDDRLCR